MDELKRQKEKERAIAEAKERVLRQLEREVNQEIKGQLPSIRVDQQELQDILGVTDQQQQDQFRYLQVLDVETENSQVRELNVELNWSEQQGDKQSNTCLFQEVQDGQLIFKHKQTQQEIQIPHRELPLADITKGKLDTIECLRQMDDKEFHKMIKRGMHIAERDGTPVENTLWGSLREKVIERSKKLLQQLVDKMGKMISGLDKLSTAVTASNQIVDREQEKLCQMPEKLQQQERFQSVYRGLEEKKQKGLDVVSDYRKMVDHFTKMLKLTLKAQFPALQVRRLTPHETLALGEVAATMSKGGLNRLQQAVIKSQDQLAQQALGKATDKTQEREQSKEQSQKRAHDSQIESEIEITESHTTTQTIDFK